MNNEPFFAPCNKKKVHTALGDNKVSSPTASEPSQKKKTNVTQRFQGEKIAAEARETWGGDERKKKGWNIRVSPPPHLKSKTEGWRRGAVEKQQGWMGRRAFTDDCSPVWAAKVWTWTSFISLQGHCPQREGSCHPALTSPHWDSQLLKIPTSQRHGTLWKSSRRREKQQHSVRLKD